MQRPWLQNLKKLTSIDSTPYVGVADVCAFYAELCEKWGIKYRFLREGEAIIINPVKDPLFVIHNSLETKDPGPHSFWDKTNFNPFEASISSGKLHGLGVASSKSSLLWQLYALKSRMEEGKETKVTFFGGSFSKMKEDLESPLLSRHIDDKIPFLVSRPTSSRVLKAICGKAKVRFSIPLGQKERDLKLKHYAQEDTATQSRIFRGVSTHGALSKHPNTVSALAKLVDYLKMLPEGVLVLNMEAGHSTDQVPSEAILELNLSQPVEESIAQKFIIFMERLDTLQKDIESLATEGPSSLPAMNIGKLRHNDTNINVDVSFYLSPQFDFNLLRQSLEDLVKDLKSVDAAYCFRQELDVLNFGPDDGLSKKIMDCHRDLEINYVEGQSVIESVARKLTEKSVPCVQFGMGTGLGNIDEPNELIRVESVDLSIKWFGNFFERSK